jgi:hypothetical protein
MTIAHLAITGLSVAIFALTTGCASTKVNVVSAVSSDSIQWPFCVDVVATNQLGILTLKGMLCAGAEVTLAQMQSDFAKTNPTATYGAVKQVSPSEIKPVAK